MEEQGKPLKNFQSVKPASWLSLNKEVSRYGAENIVLKFKKANNCKMN
jgi:hypothetical protein